jgi:hypothetical protein
MSKTDQKVRQHTKDYSNTVRGFRALQMRERGLLAIRTYASKPMTKQMLCSGITYP